MKIYDCFIYFDEDLLLDVRLNILDKFIDDLEGSITYIGQWGGWPKTYNTSKDFRYLVPSLVSNIS